MAEATDTPAQPSPARATARRPGAGGLLVSAALALTLVGMFTGLRALLNPLLGSHSPLILYLVPVAFAAFVRGGLCGLMTAIAGGLVGHHFFAAPQGSWSFTAASLTSLCVFWTVSLLVLGMAHELGRHANAVLDRVRAEPEAQNSPRQAG